MKTSVKIQAHINAWLGYDLSGSFLTHEVRTALMDMSVYYENLEYEGYWDGEVLHLTKVTNLDNDRPLHKSEVVEMFYVVENKSVLNIDEIVPNNVI